MNGYTTRIFQSIGAALLYHSHDLAARFRVWSSADGTDDRGIEAGGAPCGFGGVEQGVHRFVFPVGPVMAPQVVPQVFDGVQFGRVRWQADQRDVGRADQVVGAMVSRTIPDEHRLHVRLQRPRQLGEKEVHDARVQTRRDQSLGLARLGAHGSQHVDEPVLMLADGTRSRTGASPDASQRPLLAEPRFVFVEDLQPAVWVLQLNLGETFAELFLNSSCAAGSASGCCGRGTSDE